MFLGRFVGWFAWFGAAVAFFFFYGAFSFLVWALGVAVGLAGGCVLGY